MTTGIPERDDALMLKDFIDGLAGLTIVAFIFLVSTFPATWLLMLFLGNVGLGVSYVGTLPLGIIVSWLIGTSSSGLGASERGPDLCVAGSTVLAHRSPTMVWWSQPHGRRRRLRSRACPRPASDTSSLTDRNW